MSKLSVRIDDLVTIDPLSEAQHSVFDKWNKTDVLVLKGMAGTGKSFLSIYKALEDVLNRENGLDRITIVRSAVSSRDIGFLPGDAEEKAEVYESPYREIVNSLFPDKPDAYTRLKQQKIVVFLLTSYMRGITIDNSIIIVDECQNMTYQELATVITRVGINSKIIFCGDLRQNDLYSKSGFKLFMNVLEKMKDRDFVEFTVDDIVRSGVVKDFLIAENSYTF